MNAERDAIHLAAADWLARLREPDISSDELLNWQKWMADDARHARSFARMQEVSQLLHTLPRPSRFHSSNDSEDNYDGSIPLSEWRAMHTAKQPKAAWRRRFVIPVAIAASIFLVVAAALVVQQFRSHPNPQVVQTPIGQNRSIELPDGSNVTLGADTKLTVAMNATSRQIHLLHGEAFFKVAKDPSRPFKVHAGDATVLAVGTEFNVNRAQNQVVVSVIEGRVIVEPQTGIVPIALLRRFKSNFAAVKLDAGQQTKASGAGVQVATPLLDTAIATSWQSGRLAFRLKPLREVLEDVNRYATKPIVAEDEEIALLRVTGTVMSDNVRPWVNSLQNALGIEAVEESERIVLKSAAVRP